MSENQTESIKPGRGGAREGAGRKKGSTNKVSAKELLEAAENIIGKPFVVSLMEGYRDTIYDGDRKHRVVYERIIMDKVATQLLDVEVNDSESAVAARREIFAAALAQLTPKPQDD